MTQAAPQTSTALSLHDSRLLDLLVALGAVKAGFEQQDVAESLSTLVDINDADELAESLGTIAVMAKRGGHASSAAQQRECQQQLVAQLLETRQQIVQFIADSFDSESSGWLKPPPLTEQGELAAFEHYQRFYNSHQREIDFKVQRLRSAVRDAIAALSPRLAQLAALDETLLKTFAGLGRKALAGLPRVLRSRHQQQCNAPQQLHRELQHLLLAELEHRLQPVLGMIDALDKDPEIENPVR